ncbi:MAG: site-specific DNA-methyltransferase [Xanthomonadaceae bacterium]|nr:site-specific DNA-methyltransferase [Xanthomonadaceae bacterium]
MDLVFIDPPYNTGNEGWAYNDNVASPLIKEWLDGNPVNAEDMLRHDKWLCMMWPRLKLLHELLSERGSIWITLDDNEVHHARVMLDEIFGEQNFVASCVWQHSVQGKGYTDVFSVSHNHLLVYGKQEFKILGLERAEEHNLAYSNPDDDPRGEWRTGDVRNSLDRPNLKYPLPTPSGKFIAPPEKGWRWKPETMQVKIDRGEVLFVDDETRIIRKIFLKDQDRRSAETVWFARDVGSTRDAQAELLAIMGRKTLETIKPVALIQRALEIATEEDAIVLDSFAGSGTTAHAVLAQNAKDGGNRKFILVECEDYADSLTAERVRRVIEGYAFTGTQREELLREKLTFSKLKKANQLLLQAALVEKQHEGRFDAIKSTVQDGDLIVTGEKSVAERAEGLGGGFSYCTLGAPLALDDLLSGASLPDFEAFGGYLFHTATGQPLDPARLREADGYLGESAQYHVWLIYRADLDFLKSRDAALTLALAEKIAATGRDKPHLVFAPARFVPQKKLLELGVEHAPLPYALYRIEKG